MSTKIIFIRQLKKVRMLQEKLIFRIGSELRNLMKNSLQANIQIFTRNSQHLAIQLKVLSAPS
jgi:hypothetical protein